MKSRIQNKLFLGVYTQKYLDEHNETTIHWELTDILPTEDEKKYKKLMFENGEYYEGATIEQIQEIEQIKETEKYNKRIQDGVEIYAVISAKFRLMKKNGDIDQETHEFIEELFRPVREEVLAGQWITAKEKVEAIGSQVVGTDLFDMIHGIIVQYISENYD